MDHESVFKEKGEGNGAADYLNPLSLGKGMVSMVGNTAGIN